MAALYTENAKVLPPDAPIVTGKKGIEEFWRAAAATLGLTDIKLKTLDLEVTGDTACEVGEADLKLGSGHATKALNNYLGVTGAANISGARGVVP
jgi:ketosteroid isomerase-like protein